MVAMSNCTDQIETARRLLPGLKTDAAVLMEKWPTFPGTLPFSGQHGADAANPDFFIVHGDLSSANLSKWPCIWKVEAGGFRFDIDDVCVKVEYHPTGNMPTSFVTTVHSSAGQGQVEHNLERFVQLEPNWYLAWYSVRDL